MKRFEYQAHDVFGDSPQKDMLNWLNTFGANGWEVIAIVPISREPWSTASTATEGHRILLKREVAA